MNPARRRPGRPPVGETGAAAWRPSRGYLVVALGVLAGGLALLLLPPPAPVAPAVVAHAAPVATGQVVSTAPAAPVPVMVAAATPDQAAQPAVAPAAHRAVPRVREADADQTPDITDYINPGETPTMAEVIERLQQNGIHSGLGAFPPPGTSPPLVGIAVPEDFALPEGYVRHYQATDDGQRIEPILMFSPDRQFVDAARKPVAIPADRVVPPDLAPAGLPVRSIVIPAPLEAEPPRR